MDLILLRHGETEWSRSGRHTGRTDIPLTKFGRAEAAAIAGVVDKMLADEPAPIVYSSPLKRAFETALTVLPDASIVLRDELMEMDYGDYEGLTRSQIQEQRPGWDIWRDGCPNGESVEQVADRVDSFLTSVVSASSAALVVFAHGHLIRILAARAVGLDAAAGRIFKLDTATVSMISTDRGEQVLKMWNVPARLVADPNSSA